MSDEEKVGWSALSLLRVEPHKVMTVDELCEYLHVHPNTIYRLIKLGRIPAFRIGRRLRLNVEDIALWSHYRGTGRLTFLRQNTGRSRGTKFAP